MTLPTWLLEPLAKAQQGIGWGISAAGNAIPGYTNWRAGQGGTSLGQNYATGRVSPSNMGFPDLVKTAKADYTPSNVLSAEDQYIPQAEIIYDPVTNLPTNDGVTDASGANTSDQELAILKWLAELESAKFEADSLRTQGNTMYDTLMAAAGNYRNRAGELFKGAGQEITNIFSGLAGGNARLGQSARTKALNTARAQGYGDSSRLGLMNQVTGNIAGLQGQAMAKRGENDQRNLTDYNSKQDEATRQETYAADTKNNLESQAGDLERLGIRNATFDFAGLLQGIRNSHQAMQQINPMDATALAALTPDFGGLNDTLGLLTSSLSSSVPTSTIGTDASNLATNPASIWDLIKENA